MIDYLFYLFEINIPGLNVLISFSMGILTGYYSLKKILLSKIIVGGSLLYTLSSIIDYLF